MSKYVFCRQASAPIADQPDAPGEAGFGNLPSSGPLPPHLVVKAEQGTGSMVALTTPNITSSYFNVVRRVRYSDGFFLLLLLYCSQATTASVGRFQEWPDWVTQEQETRVGAEEEVTEELSGTEEPTWRSITPRETNRKRRRYKIISNYSAVKSIGDVNIKHLNRKWAAPKLQSPP